MAAVDTVHVNIAQMIDLALGHPEVGTVDFTMLQSVLHVLAQQLRVLNKGVELRGSAPPTPPHRVQTVAVTEYLLQSNDQQEQPVPMEAPPPDAATPLTMLVVERIKKGEGWKSDGRQPDARFKGGSDAGLDPEKRLSVVTLNEFQKLEKSVGKIQNQVFGGATNDDLIDDLKSHPGSKSITDMWTSMNWSSRIETLEAGLQKLSSLVQDLAGEYVAVQDALSTGSATKIGDTGGAPATAGATAAAAGAPPRGPRGMEQLRADVDRLAKLIGADPSPAAGAESSGGIMSAAAGKKLRDRLESMEKKMRKCCERINKVDGTVGQQMNSLQDQLVGLGDDIASVNENLSGASLPPDLLSDVKGLSDLYNAMRQMQGELKSLREAAAMLSLDKEERAHNFNVLVEQIELLKTIKMDREDMAEAMAEKADARLLARKVSHDQFESACDDLSRGLDTALSKLTTQETLWQQALDDIQREIECKLDKLEMAPVKQFFCDKLRQLQDNLRQMASLRREAEAAGTKKKFLRDVNCISCDARAVMATTEESSLPVARPMPAQQLSMKPYLTYELDQIRKQQAAGQGQRNMHDWETIDKQSKPISTKARSEAGKHLCNRYCGGSHTVTTPAQRVARLGHFLKQWGPDVMSLPATQEDKTLKPGEPDDRGVASLSRVSVQKGTSDNKKGAKPYGECRCLEDDGARA